MFKEPVHQVLEKIKNESYFKRPNKMGGDPMKHNQNLHCQYHQEQGYTTEDCRTLWNDLEQLVRDGKLKQFLHQPNGQNSQAIFRSQRDISSKPPLGTIDVILTAPGRTGSYPSRVMFIARPLVEDSNPEPKRAKMEVRLALSFSDEDKVGTIQSHDDAQVVTFKIGGMM